MSPLSLVLLVGFLYTPVVIYRLLRDKTNKESNRFLVGLLALVALKLVPYILGFSGFYQRFPWLSYAPFELESGFGPLLFLFVFARTTNGLPRRWGLHFIPLGIEFLYYLVMFVQPLSVKSEWHGRVQVYVDQVDTLFGFVSLAAYLWLATRQILRYRIFTEAHQTQGDPQLIRFLRSTLSAFGVLLALRVGFAILDWLRPGMTLDQSYLSYFWITVVIFVLGTGTVAYADPIPALVENPPSAPIESESATKDWKKVAETIEHRCISKALRTDSELTLQSFSEAVEYSPSYVSKALNNGFDESFSAFINRHRVEEVKTKMKDPSNRQDLIELAYESGFNSKASFNRIFKQITGVTPSEFRRNHQSAS